MFDLNMFTVATHVTLGVFAVTMGGIALAARKGATTHVRVGRLFVISMGLSSLLGAALGLVRYETLFITFHAGILGVTLVASAVLAVRINQRLAKRALVIVAAINALNAFGLATAGGYASTRPDAVLFGFQATDYLFLFAMAAAAFICDLGLLLPKQISHRHRIAQHLWRMCTGFFIAAGSAFTGPGSTAFPAAVQNSGVLSLPELMILVLMLFWLYKTLRQRQAGRNVSI